MFLRLSLHLIGLEIFYSSMDLQEAQFRRIASLINPVLVESWCPMCGLFVAASKDLRILKTAENSHHCGNNGSAEVPQAYQHSAKQK